MSKFDNPKFQKDIMNYLKYIGEIRPGYIRFSTIKATNVRLHFVIFSNSIDEYKVCIHYKDYRKKDETAWMRVNRFEFLEWKLLDPLYE